eukprot:322922-Hanusia_phi.AAC.2
MNESRNKEQTLFIVSSSCLGRICAGSMRSRWRRNGEGESGIRSRKEDEDYQEKHEKQREEGERG